MKKILCILICFCMLLCLTACLKGTENNPEAESSSSIKNSQTQNSGDLEEVRILTLEKALYTYYEWADDLPQALVRSEHSCVTLGQKEAESFPEMAKVLNQIATMQEKAMLEEYENLVSLAQDAVSGGSTGFETYVSTLDVQVRRADSTVISLLTDSYSHYGRIENFRVRHSSNYDTESGKELMLNDVVKQVNNDLAEAVQKELTGHTLTGELKTPDAVENYFANTPYDGFTWTMDYNGLTFYFSPEDLCDEGAMTATISFEEYPELFNEKYMVVPTEYSVDLPLDMSFFTQLDKDDALEAISISGLYNDKENHYSDFGVYTDTDGQYYYEEGYAYDLHPYYVKTVGGNYVYLFCEDFEEGLRQMRLSVLALNTDGSVTKIGEMNVSPSWLADNKFVVPTDPSNLILDDTDKGTQKAVYSVGKNGMPSQ